MHELWQGVVKKSDIGRPRRWYTPFSGNKPQELESKLGLVSIKLTTKWFLILLMKGSIQKKIFRPALPKYVFFVTFVENNMCFHLFTNFKHFFMPQDTLQKPQPQISSDPSCARSYVILNQFGLGVFESRKSYVLSRKSKRL